MPISPQELQTQVDAYKLELASQNSSSIALFDMTVNFILASQTGSERQQELQAEADKNPMLAPYLDLIAHAREFKEKHQITIAYLASLGSGYWRELGSRQAPFVNDLAEWVVRGKISSEGEFLLNLEYILEMITFEIVGYNPSGINVDDIDFEEGTREIIIDLATIRKEIANTLGGHLQELEAYKMGLENKKQAEIALVQEQKKQEKRRSLEMGEFQIGMAELSIEDSQILSRFSPLIAEFEEYRATHHTQIAKAAETDPGFKDIQDRIASAEPVGIVYRWQNGVRKPGNDPYWNLMEVHGYLDDIVQTWSDSTKPFWVPDERVDAVVDSAPAYIKELYVLFQKALDLLFAMEEPSA